ncbi:MAG: hypothetical protein M1816_008066 [Peltula sp. TS41687]|nr:MAG: hypothetical protein M1816_008066 [Peltula sp. TS41687]
MRPRQQREYTQDTGHISTLKFYFAVIFSDCPSRAFKTPGGSRFDHYDRKRLITLDLTFVSAEEKTEVGDYFLMGLI